MKKVIIILLCLFNVAYAQRWQNMPQNGYGPVKGFWVDSLLIIPTSSTGGLDFDNNRTVGKIRYNITDSALQAWTGYQWRNSGGVSSNIYTADGYLTGSRILKGGGVYSLIFDSLTNFYVNRNAINRILVTPTQTLLASQNTSAFLSMAGSLSTLQTSGANTIKSDDGASESNIVINAESIEIKPDEGVLVIDSLSAGTTNNKIVGWTETAGADRGKTGALSLGEGVSISSGTINVSPPLSRITSANGSNTIDNLNYLQTWQWNTHTGLFPALILGRTSTSLNTTGASMLSIVSSGANASSNAIASGLQISVTNTGTNSSNNALSLSASGANTNRALIINSGDVTLSPLIASRPLKLDASKIVTSGLIDLASANDVTGLLPIANGGLNNNAAPTSGYVLVGDGTKYVPTEVPVTASDQYDPTGSNEVNLDSWTMSTLQYLRVGDRVTVSGIIELKATAAATTTSLDIELPVATSFDNNSQAGGTGWSSEVAGAGFAVTSIGSGDKVKIAFVSVDTSTHVYSFTFTYKVI